MTNEKAILEALNILCDNHRVSASKHLIMAWSLGLDDIESDYIMRGLQEILKERDNPFMPTVGEFRAICKGLKKKDVITQRNQEEQKQIEYEREHGPELISYKEYCKRANREPSDYFGSEQVQTQNQKAE